MYRYEPYSRKEQIRSLCSTFLSSLQTEDRLIKMLEISHQIALIMNDRENRDKFKRKLYALLDEARKTRELGLDEQIERSYDESRLDLEIELKEYIAKVINDLEEAETVELDHVRTGKERI